MKKAVSSKNSERLKHFLRERRILENGKPRKAHWSEFGGASTNWNRPSNLSSFASRYRTVGRSHSWSLCQAVHSVDTDIEERPGREPMASQGEKQESIRMLQCLLAF